MASGKSLNKKQRKRLGDEFNFCFQHESKRFRFGDVVIADFPFLNKEYGSKIRPSMVVGCYEMKNGGFYYLLFPQTSTSHIYSYPLDNCYNDKNGAGRSMIVTKLALLSETRINRIKGVIGRIKMRYFPDIIAYRVSNILFSSVSQFKNEIANKDTVVSAMQVTIEDIAPNMVYSDVLPIDIHGGLERELGYEPAYVEFPNIGISQEDVNAITRWMKATVYNARENKEPLKLPVGGDWPNWPDVERRGEVISCHALVTDKPTIKDNTPKTAAQIRLKDFGDFKL